MSRYLSKTQNIRLAGLITVLSGREPYEWILGGLVADGYVVRADGLLTLTEAGIKEKDRLAFLAGLIIEKDDARPIRTIFDKSHQKNRQPLTERLPVNPAD